jgi:nicotinamidase-related amidase
VSSKNPPKSPATSRATPPESTAESADALTAHDVLTVELSTQILSGRPQRLLDMAIAQLPIPPEVAARELAAVNEALASLALSNEVDKNAVPSAGLRARILNTLAARSQTKPIRRALLVIEVPRAREIIPALEARIEAARKDKMPIIYICDQHEPGDSDMEEWAVHNVRGTEGAEVWPTLAPKPGDAIVHKPTYSSFTRSNLAETLAALKVDTLVLSGCSTELGMLATATDALQRGYAIEIPRDTQAGMIEASEQMALVMLSVMPPYGPAREQLLAQITA